MKEVGIVVVALAAVLVLVFFGNRPGPNPAVTGAEIAQIEAEVREDFAKLVTEYGNVAMAGDGQAIASFWTSDARAWHPGSYVTAEDLAALTEEDFASITITAVDAKILDIFVHGDVAYVISEISEGFQYEGQEPGTEHHICFTRLEREDGVWRFDRDVCGPRDAPTEG